MKICHMALNYVQIFGHTGIVKLCPWRYDSVIGSLSESTMLDIWHGEKANAIRQKMLSGDYSGCYIDACPYLANGEVDKHTVEIDEIPEYPQELYLAFETICNYDCTGCNAHKVMECNQSQDVEAGYQLIEDRLRDILPHVKVLSASGYGELFLSRHTLKMLSEWHPLAPKEQCSVELESNGALFDPKHWEQIADLGQYNLRVDITVMSFKEKIYQILSGTKLPISQIENNLHFIKSLREKGIINYLEIATVYQERNFRDLPEFARRCIEEFGADYVRLRPYMQAGKFSPDVEWFTDVRGKYHPYHQEFLEVMQDPILKHPKVHDWGGGGVSLLGKLPSFEKAENLQRLVPICDKRHQMLNKYRAFCTKIVSSKKIINRLVEIIYGKKFFIYGLGAVGKELVQNIGSENLKGILDEYTKETVFYGFPIYRLKDVLPEWHEYDVLVTPLTDREEICHLLKEEKFIGNIIDVFDVIENM